MTDGYRYTAEIEPRGVNDSNGSEAVGRLEVLSAKATATFSEPNLKLDEIRQLNPDYPEAPCATSKSAS